MILSLDPLELAVLELVLVGDHPVLVTLRSQLEGIEVRKRELTGVGFVTELIVAKQTNKLPSGTRLRFGDVEGTIPGLTHGAGFLVFVDDGVLTLLEGYSYSESWPSNISGFALRYSEPTRNKLFAYLDGVRRA